MIHFRDMAFCSASNRLCRNTECDRYFGPEDQAEADAWWGEPGAPVAFMDFTPGCKIMIACGQEYAGRTDVQFDAGPALGET